MSMAIGGYSPYSYGSYGMNYGNLAVQGKDNHSPNPDENVKVGRKSSPEDCETCKNRKYQDGSNEGDVSFKSPGHVSPQASAGAVMSHEMQHVANAYEKEADGNHKVLSASVRIKTAICPECGTSYVAGGETQTSILTKAEKPNPYAEQKKALAAMAQKGKSINYVA